MHQGTKYTKLDYHYIKDKEQDEIIELQYTPTYLQYADILMKPLGPIEFVEN